MKVKFSRCVSNNLASVPQTDGQLIYVKDNNELYLDVGSNRVKLSDIIEVANKDTVVSPILSKLYYETSTDMLYKAKIQNNDIVWIALGGVTELYVATNFLKKDNTTAYTPTNNYNPATKKYVDDVIQQIQPDILYTKEFEENDWEVNGQQFILTITQAEHLLANPYVISMQMLSDNEYILVSMVGSRLLPNGSIIIISDFKYSGKLVLKGGV